jgi:uncharacterized protein (DUF58 family)
VLAFSAIRNNDKVGLILFTDDVEKYMPPKKGRRHVLRVIREILFFEPQRRGTNLSGALDFLNRVTAHRAITVVISDFLEPGAVETVADQSVAAQVNRAFSRAERRKPVSTLASALRQANRRHDVVAVQIIDRHELDLPPLGRLILQDAETGDVVEVNTRSGVRSAFAAQQRQQQMELERMLRSARIDAIRLRTDEPYGAALGRFFETRERRRMRG